MLNVQKKSVKTIEDYRHSIKLLKYHLKKQQKTNQKLKYQQAKSKHKSANPQQNQRHKIYSLSETVKTVSERLKKMGLVLEDLFRMADSNYQGQINRQQFMKVIYTLRTNLDQSLFTEMFYAIDTSANGLISEDQFIQFSIAYGGCTNSKQIRKFEKATKSKLGNLIQKKHGSVSSFLQKFPQPFTIHSFQKQLRNLGLTENQTMIMMKTFDPAHQGVISHKLFSSLMDKVKFKSQSQQKEEEYQKGIQELCAYWRDHKMNPIVIFQQADVDGKQGVSVFELEQAFKKLIPGQTNFQIKKWVSMINLNNDNQITKDQFLNSIRSFYSLNQMSKFSDQYAKLHPELAITDEQSIESIMKQLSIKIEDSGMTKTETFHFIDFNKNGELSKQEMVEGLKRLGMKVGFAGRVVSVFDRDASSQVSLKQWLRVLGEDIEVSEVPVPNDMDSFFQQSEQGQKSKLKQPIKPKQKSSTKPTNPTKPTASKDKTLPTKKPQKQNTNKTSKIPPETKLEQSSINTINKSNKKGILDKKFKEDQIKKSEKKVSDNNKTLKKVSKKEIKEVINQKPIADDVEDDNIFDVGNTDEIEEKVAKIYKKNKNRTAKMFEKQDKKKSGKIKMKEFIAALKGFGKQNGIEIDQVSAKEIFGKYCVNGEFVEYRNWLQESSDIYAQDVSSGSELKEQMEEKPSKKQIQQQKFDDQGNNQQDQYDNQFDQDQFDQDVEEQPKKPQKPQKPQKQQKPKKQQNKQKQQKFDINPIIKATLQKNQVQNKRGIKINAFTQLLTLSLVDGKKTQKGYKLIEYIDNSGNNIKQLRDKKIKGFEEFKKKNGNKKFTDKEFPVNKKSLDSGDTQCHISNMTLIKWKHYSQIFKAPKLVSGNVEPNDILQGGLGNCYFLCALACLSEYTNVIQRLFEFIDIEIGYFLVWLCIDGEWQLVQLDGFIPVGSDGEPAFSRTTTDQLWVILLEKAYAKVYGCYNHIVGGQPYEAIKDLSGAPGLNYYHDKVSINQLWQKLVQANKRQFLMSCGTPARPGQGVHIDGRQEGVTSDGIVLGHAYSILDCKQIQKNRLVQLRNPWGDIQWKGQWSDHQTKKWTAQLKNKMHHQTSENDGIFWMPLEHFFKNFIMTSINVLRPNYYYDSCIQKNIKQIACKLKSDDFGSGCFMANRIDHRHKGQSGQPYPLMSMVGFVASKQGKILHKIKQRRFLYERQGMIEFNQMQKYPNGSEAIVLISAAQSSDLVVGYYGDKKIELEVDNNCMNYFEKLAIHDEDNETTQSSGPLKCWLSEVQGVGFMVFKNVSPQDFTLQVTIDSPTNIKLLPPSSKKNKQKIAPNDIFTIRGKLIDPLKGFNFNQQIQLAG